MRFGQVVIGPPGSGKSTYCKAMKAFLKELGRTALIVNVDAANDCVAYEADLSVTDLITIDDVMKYKGLGPNGGLIYCMQFLEENLVWFKDELNKLCETHEAKNDNIYLLFDFPGQVELYTHCSFVRTILKALQTWDYRLVNVQLTDSHYATDPSKFVSVLLSTLSSMLQLEMPHISVLSKADLLEAYSPASFNLDYFLEVLDLRHLIDLIPDDPFVLKHKKLTEAIAGIIEDYSLVSFQILDVQDKKSMFNVLQQADAACGYKFSNFDTVNASGESTGLRSCVATNNSLKEDLVHDANEKYLKQTIGNDRDHVVG